MDGGGRRPRILTTSTCASTPSQSASSGITLHLCQHDSVHDNVHTREARKEIQIGGAQGKGQRAKDKGQAMPQHDDASGRAADACLLAYPIHA